jgi:hypothetical protein
MQGAPLHPHFMLCPKLHNLLQKLQLVQFTLHLHQLLLQAIYTTPLMRMHLLRLKVCFLLLRVIPSGIYSCAIWDFDMLAE